MSEYRIVRDRYLGFEVQCRRWWFPFWVQCGFSNTHQSPEDAEAWVRRRATERSRTVVKKLGKLP